MSRYSRHIVLSDIGQEGQDKLSLAKVLIVGAGGLGCPVLQYLTAAGIGTIGVIDFDTVDESNLQRQILFGTSSLGINKALAAKKRLEDLNPTITINAYPNALTSKNAITLFETYDIVVDGTDNFATRYLINDAAIISNKPVVYGAIYKFEGQVSVFNYKDGPSYRCLFPNPPKEGSVANCSEVGVLGVLPGIIGAMQANEVVKIILDFDHVLSGKLLCYDAKTTATTTLLITRSQLEIEKVIEQKGDFISIDFEETCSSQVKEITFEASMNSDNIQFIDIRELNELPKVDLPNLIQIPLSNIEDHFREIPIDKTIVLFCHSGIRSKKAVELLQKNNISNCFSLKGGIISINEHRHLKTL